MGRWSETGKKRGGKGQEKRRKEELKRHLGKGRERRAEKGERDGLEKFRSFN